MSILNVQTINYFNTFILLHIIVLHITIIIIYNSYFSLLRDIYQALGPEAPNYKSNP